MGGTNLKEYLKLVESDKELWNFNFCVDLHLILLQKSSLFFTFPFKNIMISMFFCWYFLKEKNAKLTLDFCMYFERKIINSVKFSFMYVFIIRRTELYTETALMSL
ncbi:hypothetical protein EK904_003507, partial [Melospiza melodia maxima]